MIFSDRIGESPGELDVASQDDEPPTVDGDAVGLSQELTQAAFCMMCQGLDDCSNTHTHIQPHARTYARTRTHTDTPPAGAISRGGCCMHCLGFLLVEAIQDCGSHTSGQAPTRRETVII